MDRVGLIRIVETLSVVPKQQSRLKIKKINNTCLRVMAVFAN